MQNSRGKLYSFYIPEFDEIRYADENSAEDDEPYRTAYRRDFARVIHSPSFRRLNGKTQLYPNNESDFFRNRLSHSLEVAQIAKSIAMKLNYENHFPDGTQFDLNTDLIETSALCHDIGHPPFGHQGEHELDSLMNEYGGFEGNAQTLRIISKIEKRVLVNTEFEYGITDEGDDIRVGLNLTYRTLASVLKYDKIIPVTINERLSDADLNEGQEKNLHPVKGFYKCDSEIVTKVKEAISREAPQVPGVKFKTVECKIMDLADDIAYSTYDLEDGLKAGFFDPVDIIFSREELLLRIANVVSEKIGKQISFREVQDVFIEIFKQWLFEDLIEQERDIPKDEIFETFLKYFSKIYKTSKRISKNGYSRVGLTSNLVSRFISGVKINLDINQPQFSDVFFDEDTRLMVEVVKTFNYESIILSPRLKIAEFRGQEIVRKIFTTLNDHEGKGFHLLPKDYQRIYNSCKKVDKPRIICDFVSGMSDRYCIEFYGRLTSELPETIFKPF
jgi:dGTPase